MGCSSWQFCWYSISSSDTERPDRSARLRQQDQQLKLWFGEIVRHIRGEVAGASHGFPRGARLVQTEVLILQLDRQSAGRAWQMFELDSGQGLFDQVLNVGGRADLDQPWHVTDDGFFLGFS